MMTKGEQAVAKFSSGYNCAQSVLSVFCLELGLDKDQALKIACGFGAGMGRKEEVCGAVSGGIMVISLRFGRGERADRQATEVTYTKVRELMDRFSQRHGTYLCRKLLDDCDLMADEGQKTFLNRDYFNTICKPCVKSVVEIVEKIMQRSSEK